MRATVELLADSSQIRTAEKDLSALNQVGVTTEKVQARIGSSAQVTAKKIGSLARSASNNRREFLKLERTTTALQKEIERLRTSTERTKAPLGGLGKGTTSAGRGMAGLGRNAGQAGIQVQQFVGQIQGGQNALLALSQQSADLGFVIGVPLAGAIVGISASVLGFLLPTLFSSKKATDDLENSIALLTETAALGSNGILDYSEQIERLAEVSSLAAKGRIDAAIRAGGKAAVDAAQSIKDEIADRLDLGAIFSSLDKSVSSARTFGDRAGANLRIGVSQGTNNVIADQIAKQLGITGENAREAGAEIIEMIANIEKFKTPESFTIFEERIAKLRETAGRGAQKTIDELVGAIGGFIDQGRDASTIVRQLQSDAKKGILPSLEDKATSATKATERLSSSLQTQIIALQSGAQAAEIYALVQANVGTEQENQIPTLIGLVNQKYALITAQKLSTEEAKKEAKAQSDLEKSYGAFEAKLDQAEQAEQRRADTAQKRLAGVAGGSSGLTRLQVLEQQYKDERTLLLQAQSQGFDSEVAYKDRLLQLESEFAENKKGLSKQFELVDFEAFENRAAGAFASVAVGAQTGKEAVQGLGIGIVQEGIGSLIKYGITAAATWAADALGFTAATAVKTTAVIAGTAAQTTASTAAVGTLTATGVVAGGALAAAYAPAAAAASIATAGGAPAAATPIALGSIGTIIAALVGGLALSSTFARASGGQVQAGGSYLVGERGAELFSPNSSGGGRITPFNQLMNEARGGSGQNITDNSNVNINVSGTYQTGEDLLLANRDLIYRIVSDAKRKQGQRF
jgi:hypothetical protein